LFCVAFAIKLYEPQTIHNGGNVRDHRSQRM
jgi:hypothetical protein